MQYLGAKQPAEEYYVTFDFTNVLGTSDVATAAVTVIDQATLEDVTSTLTDATLQAEDGKEVNVRVRGGTPGCQYKITCLITDTSAVPQTFELDAVLPVIEG